MFIIIIIIIIIIIMIVVSLVYQFIYLLPILIRFYKDMEFHYKGSTNEKKFDSAAWSSPLSLLDEIQVILSNFT